MNNLEKRKKEHLKMVTLAQRTEFVNDMRFNYEPVLGIHPIKERPHTFTFLGKQMNAPLWISSMTGGTKEALQINERLARICAEFKLGMGLGSCRQLLESKRYLKHFNWRSLLEDRPFYANLGIAQIEQLLRIGHEDKILELIDLLQADGLIIHINPLQEWTQKGGDRWHTPPLKTIELLMNKISCKIIAKEVGQGMGPKSLRALLQLPLAAIEFAAFGGTNFTQLELMRNKKAHQSANPFIHVGHTANEMVDLTLSLLVEEKERKCPQFIISGGVKSFLDGFYFCKKLERVKGVKAIYGQAQAFLHRAQGSYKKLHGYVASQIEGLRLAENYLFLKEQ